jgi:mRNA interferase MazF
LTGSTLTSGDVVDLDLGSPSGREAGLRRPVVVVTAQEILDESVSVVQVVPLTSTMRPFGSEVRLSPDEHNGLGVESAAQCQHIRSVSVDRVEAVRGNVGGSALSEIREVLGLILDIN